MLTATCRLEAPMMANQAPASRSLRRTLRAGLALVCLALSLAYAAFWVRSHSYEQILSVGLTNSRVRIDSLPAGLRIESRPYQKASPPFWHWSSVRRGGDVFRSPRFPWEHDKLVAGFAYARGPRPWGLALATPHWFPVVALALAAIALAPPPRWRFSLRRLLAVTTIVALALGALAASMSSSPSM